MLLSALPQMAVQAAETVKLYEAQTDSQDDIFQYHFAGGTDAFMSGASTTGRAYDAYLWVPQNTAPGELKSLVAIKANLVEIPLVYSSKLKTALSKRNSGILFIVSEKDSMMYNNTLSSFHTRLDYAGNPTSFGAEDFTTDGKDAAQIMDDILGGIAAASGYTEIKDTTPLITIGHSAASPFGYRSGNWNPDRIIAQVQMKNGMDGATHQVPGIPSLQLAAQYTEHDMNKGRDRSVVDARWHISNERAKNTNALVSHIIEWGSGHYDWSDNATDIMVKYIEKAIDYRVPADYSSTHKLNDLTGSGYLMKPFEKDPSGNERAAGYYADTLHGWLSSGQDNSGASDADKKASFWYFDKEFADYVNAFTSYAIPPSPGSNDTKVEGATYSSIEPYMLMKNPSEPTRASISGASPDKLAAWTGFASNPMSRYGNTRFVDYLNIGNSSATAQGSVQGYGELTADTYYMSKIPTITAGGKQAYDGEGNDANTYAADNGYMAQLVPLMAPYEIVKTEPLDMSTMESDGGSETANIASAARTTLRFHNNRVYYRAGNRYTNEYDSQLDSYGEILSPEITADGEVRSAFKSTGIQMNVPYVNKGTPQTLTLNTIPNISIKDATENPKVGVSYTSTDKDLEKYTDVFVEYGPAKEIRTVNEDGSYSWQIEVLLDEIPENAAYPIEINVVASNLGKWETTYGATVSQKVYITDKDVNSGVYLDGTASESYDKAVNDASSNDDPHTVTVYSDCITDQRSEADASENITFANGDFAAEIRQNSNNMMFLVWDYAADPNLTFGKPAATETNRDTALTFNADGKGRFAEINKGSMNIYNGVIITGGSDNRGGGIDNKKGSTLNMHGGIITGNTATGNLGGGGVSIVGSGIMNMTGGTITGNTSTGSYGGGVSVMENGSTLNMSGGTITGNTGYDVYMSSNNTTINLSGSAKIGSLFIASGRSVTVNAPFTTSGSHAEITPESYSEGTAVVTYTNGVTPSTSDFTIAANGETAWYTYIDGQSLKLTSKAPYAITAQNVTADKSAAMQGETVTVTVPNGYVENSLVVSGVRNTDLTKISDNTFSFSMPDAAVKVSCLVNNDPNKLVIVGTNDTFYARNDHSLNVSFNVPAADTGYTYKSAEVNVPVRAHGYNALNMAAVMNSESYTIDGGNVSGTGSVVKAGEINTLTITNEKDSGVDYYSYENTQYYPETASNLSALTLTKAVSAEMVPLNADVTDADINKDAVGYYINDLKIPSWNPALKWQITFNDGQKAQSAVTLPALSGSGSISFGIIMYGDVTNGGTTYTTSDITAVEVIE